MEAKMFNIHSESHCIPFRYVIEAIEFMQYGSGLRVMFEMLFLTGCRISELDNMKLSKIYGNWIYWKLGKNQKRHRKEELPKKYVEELKHYREHNKVYSDKLFSMQHDTFRREFNKKIRPKLSRSWQQLRLIDKDGLLQQEYFLQLKGLRKNYQTLDFAKQLKKWNDAYIALEFTSKKMRHSSKRITAYHYLENFEDIEILKYREMTPAEILSQANQTRIFDFI